jgi:hypothetical protein
LDVDNDRGRPPGGSSAELTRGHGALRRAGSCMPRDLSPVDSVGLAPFPTAGKACGSAPRRWQTHSKDCGPGMCGKEQSQKFPRDLSCTTRRFPSRLSAFVRSSAFADDAGRPFPQGPHATSRYSGGFPDPAAPQENERTLECIGTDPLAFSSSATNGPRRDFRRMICGPSRLPCDMDPE